MPALLSKAEDEAQAPGERRGDLETVWDWVTVFCFAGLVTLMLQRSAAEEPQDELWQYAPPAVGFAVANYLGNHDQPLFAGAILVAAIAYIFKVLKVTLPGR